MANIKSAKKRMKQALVRRDRNRAVTSRMRSAVKKVRTAVSANDAKLAQECLPETISIIDSTASKGVIHANAAARLKSRLTKAVSGLSA